MKNGWRRKEKEKSLWKTTHIYPYSCSIFLIALVGCGLIISKGDTSDVAALFDVNNMTSEYFLYIFGGLCIIRVLLWLTKLGDEKPSNSGAKSTQKGKLKKFYDTNWLTEEALRTNPAYNYNDYNNLKNVNKCGIPIRAEYKGGKLHINMFGPIHTLVIGTTGSGKTTQFVDPMIQILSETKAKPSLVISDPKGELYMQNVVKLKENGYDVQVVDLREPDKSSRWNPIERAFDYYQRAHND